MMNRPMSSPLSIRLAEKKQELQSLQQLQQTSASLVEELKALQAHLETLADGTEGRCLSCICTIVGIRAADLTFLFLPSCSSSAQ
jgi:hypothetical protein